CFSPKDSFEGQGRPGRRALFSYTCGRPAYSFREFCEPAENRLKSYCLGFRPLNPCTQERHRMPSIPVGLLRTCRLIRAEATPILYMRNVFHFHDALSLHRFRRNTASEAEAVEEISLRPVDDDPWSDYICGSNPDTPDRKLRRDFPKLRRLVINLADRIEPPEEMEEPLYQDFARHITGLDWVHITGIDDDPSSLLQSMLCRTPSSKDSDNPASSEVENVQSPYQEHDDASNNVQAHYLVARLTGILHIPPVLKSQSLRLYRV
ncbi:MAG: hypothetical protein L6R35_005464, partial [Caloplaca aegaea]